MHFSITAVMVEVRVEARSTSIELCDVLLLVLPIIIR